MFGLSVLMQKTGDRFVAHCLELDIVADAGSAEQARQELDALVAAQIEFAVEHHNLHNLYHPAPPEFWAKFAEANSPQQALPEWARGLELSKTMAAPPFVVTIQYVYVEAEATSPALA